MCIMLLSLILFISSYVAHCKEVDLEVKPIKRMENCDVWAARFNDCQGNPSLLWSACTSSCLESVKDDNEKCTWWADTGECTANPKYIHVHCPQKCGYALAWNPFVRANLSVTNYPLTSKVELEKCRIPKDVLSSAKILKRRLKSYMNGHHSTEGIVTAEFYQRTSEYYLTLGLAEGFLYTLRLYEVLFFYFNDETQNVKNLERIGRIYSVISVEDSDVVMRNLYGWIALLDEAHSAAEAIVALNSSSNSSAAGTVPNAFSDSPLASLLEDTKCPPYTVPNLDYIPKYLFPSTNCNGPEGCLRDASGSAAGFGGYEGLLGPDGQPDPNLIYGGDNAYGDELRDYYPGQDGTNDQGGFDHLSRKKRTFNSDVSTGGVAGITIAHTITLANGVVMPMVGYGTYLLSGEACIETMIVAMEVGYRLFDIGGSAFSDELSIGAAIDEAIDRGVISAREELFLVNKLNNHTHLGERNVTLLVKEQLRRLGTTYLDLFLLDTPPADEKLEISTWRGIEKVYSEGLVRAIGLSNYESSTLAALLPHTKVLPMVLQNKFDVYHVGKTLDISGESVLDYCLMYGIVMIGYAPLSGYPFALRPVDDPIVRYIASHHSAAPGDVNSTATSSNSYGATDSSSVGTGSGSINGGYPVNNFTSFAQILATSDGGVNYTSITGTTGITLNTNSSSVGVAGLGLNHTDMTEFYSNAAKSKQITSPAQVLLRWSLQHNIVVLTQSVSRARMEESLAVLKMRELDDDEMVLLNSLQHLISHPLNMPLIL